MSFRSAADTAYEERDYRKNLRSRLLKFGISFLDDALLGILPTDLILIGAPAGVGKTQFCCNLAYTNIRDGKRVHYIALEADQYEIERRIKFQIIAEEYYSSATYVREKLSYDRWLLGDFNDILPGYEINAADEFNEKYKNLFLFYKDGDFGVNDLISHVMMISQDTDLILVDHVHYFDFDDMDENRAMKQIAKTARMLALERKIPIILIAHLRKRDRNNNQLVADMEEFHGTSDLYKIATRVITFAPGPKILGAQKYHTYFRIPKNRLNGSVTRYTADIPYNIQGSNYETHYKLGGLNGPTFQEIGISDYPDWASSHMRSSSGNTTYIVRPSVPND